MPSRESSLQVIRPVSACFAPFSRTAPCRRLRRRTDTARPLLLFLALMAISTCAGLHLKWEDDLCGHATLASAYVLTLRKHTAWPVRFHTRSGVLTVTREQDGFELDFPARPPQPCATPVELLPALGLKAAQVMRSRDYLVVVDDAEQVRALSPNIAALAQLDTGIGGAIVTAPGEADVDYVCRFFAPAVGIAEDPATGSIHCTLAPYWAGRLGKRTLRAQQLSARGGSMQCKIAGDRVEIVGQARLYLQGTIAL